MRHDSCDTLDHLHHVFCAADTELPVRRCKGNFGMILPTSDLLNTSKPHAVAAAGEHAPRTARRPSGAGSSPPAVNPWTGSPAKGQAGPPIPAAVRDAWKAKAPEAAASSPGAAKVRQA